MTNASLHQKILNELRRRITSGKWLPGHRIPFETALAADFGVSRMTMNKVLAQLTREGFLERRRRLGTVVKLPNVQTAVLEITEIEKEVASLGLVHSYRLLARRQRPMAPTDFPGFAMMTGTKVLMLQCLHFADESPFCLENRVINLAAVPAALQVDFKSVSPSHWLLRQVPWTSARHTISAIAASQDVGRLLQIKTGSACLVVDRITELNGSCITSARLAYPGERHQMVAQFAPR
jgi:GntR family histidine utilization transcriptional repressor